MDSALALTELEQLVERMDIEVRRESLPGPGGLCQVRGKRVLFLNSEFSVADQVGVIAEALRGLDLSHLYVRPALRQLLGEGEGTGPSGGP